MGSLHCCCCFCLAALLPSLLSRQLIKQQLPLLISDGQLRGANPAGYVCRALGKGGRESGHMAGKQH